MSKLTSILEAVADLTADEHYQLTIWLLEHRPTRSNKQSDHNGLVPELFRGTLIVGRSGLGKSEFLNKLLSNKP